MARDQLVMLSTLVAVALVLSGIRRRADVVVRVEDRLLWVELGAWDTLYCLKRRLRIPLASVASVAALPKDQVPRTGLRLPGTSWPGLIRAGSYGIGDNRDFWDVRRAATYLVIELRPRAEYRRIVLEVPDPAGEAGRLRDLVVAAGESSSD